MDLGDKDWRYEWGDGTWWGASSEEVGNEDLSVGVLDTLFSILTRWLRRGIRGTKSSS